MKARWKLASRQSEEKTNGGGAVGANYTENEMRCKSNWLMRFSPVRIAKDETIAGIYNEKRTGTEHNGGGFQER